MQSRGVGRVGVGGEWHSFSLVQIFNYKKSSKSYRTLVQIKYNISLIN